MKTYTTRALLIVFCACFVVSCAPTSGKDLAAPINCETAEEDIKLLEAERRNVAQRMLTGATNVAPAGAAIRLVRGQWTDGMRVATGAYNEDLEERIAEIKYACGL